MSACSGKGIFLLLKECTIFLTKKQDGPYIVGTFVGSIYLDKYGEEDIGFKRGKPLFLNQSLYEQLWQLWLTHSFDEETVKKGTRHYQL